MQQLESDLCLLWHWHLSCKGHIECCTVRFCITLLCSMLVLQIRSDMPQPGNVQNGRRASRHGLSLRLDLSQICSLVHVRTDLQYYGSTFKNLGWAAAVSTSTWPLPSHTLPEVLLTLIWYLARAGQMPHRHLLDISRGSISIPWICCQNMTALPELWDQAAHAASAP